MDSAVRNPKVRYVLGIVTTYFSILCVLVTFFGGVMGVALLVLYVDVFRLGNDTVGPAIPFTLALEGLLLDLVPTLLTAYLGICIQVTHAHSMKEKKKKKKKWVTFEGGIHPGEDEWEEQRRRDSIGSFQTVEEYMKFEKIKKSMEKFAESYPQYLWFALLSMSIFDLVFAICCFFAVGQGWSTMGMSKGIASYGKDPMHRKAIDWIQKTGWCCAEDSYTEWLEVQWCMEKPEWVPDEYISSSLFFCPKKHEEIKYDVPASCCADAAVGPCVSQAMDILGFGSINPDGCGPYLKEIINPKFSGIAWFNVGMAICKLILMVFVLLLFPVENPYKGEKMFEDEATRFIY